MWWVGRRSFLSAPVIPCRTPWCELPVAQEASSHTNLPALPPADPAARKRSGSLEVWVLLRTNPPAVAGGLEVRALARGESPCRPPGPGFHTNLPAPHPAGSAARKGSGSLEVWGSIAPTPQLLPGAWRYERLPWAKRPVARRCTAANSPNVSGYPNRTGIPGCRVPKCPGSQRGCECDHGARHPVASAYGPGRQAELTVR